MKKFLLDSVILIDHLNKISEASKWLMEHHQQSFISVISRAEILTGIERNELSLVRSFLDRFETIPITAAEADLAAALRKDFKWKLPDALQAAIAQNYQLTLVTRNTKDFSPHKHSFVAVPYNLPNSLV